MALSLILLFLFLHGAQGARIIGGRESVPHSRPYVATFRNNGERWCGGVLVREDFVLSAAHCAVNRPLTVVLGAHTLSQNEPTKQVFTALRTYVHPRFNATGIIENDIMLVKLNGRARITSAVQTIQMRRNRVPPNTVCLAAGWGVINSQNQYPDRLREVNIRIATKQRCMRKYPKVLDSMVCGLGVVRGKGVCSGDSGGPLVCNGQLTGLTSFTYLPCGDPNIPDVFTRISSFTNWIAGIMNN